MGPGMDPGEIVKCRVLASTGKKWRILLVSKHSAASKSELLARDRVSRAVPDPQNLDRSALDAE